MLAGIALTLVSLWYGRNHGLLPVAASAEAAMIDELFNTMMIVSIGLFILVQGILVISLFRFRRRPDDLTDGPPIHGNIPLEILWTAIPAVVVFVIGVYSFEVYKELGGFDPDAARDPGVTQVAMLPGDDMAASLIKTSDSHLPGHHHMALGIGAFPKDEGRPADLVVDVTGLQYAWIFKYPASGVTSGELHVAAGKEVQLNIKAQDVIHAFWLPEFRLKQDAIPGRPAELRFKPQRLGEYPVVCAELCGPYHGAMGAKLFVQTPEEFDQWLQAQIASNNPDVPQTVALNPQERSGADYLAPLVEHMPDETALTSHLDSHLVEQLHSQPSAF